jgi:DNA replication and repair protein RecF
MDVPRRTFCWWGTTPRVRPAFWKPSTYLATYASFHAQNDRQLINFLAAREPLAVTRLVADFAAVTGLRHLEVRLIQESLGATGTRACAKRSCWMGSSARCMRRWAQFTAVIFLPQMTRVIEGGPEDRRRYLNLALSQVVPGYSQALSEYSQA